MILGLLLTLHSSGVSTPGPASPKGFLRRNLSGSGSTSQFGSPVPQTTLISPLINAQPGLSASPLPPIQIPESMPASPNFSASQLKIAEQRIGDLEEKLAELKAINRNQESDLSEKWRLQQAAEAQQVTLQNQKEDISREQKRLETEIARTKEQLTALQKQVQESEENLQETRQQSDANEASWKAEMRTLRQQLEKAHSEHETLSKQHDQQKKELTTQQTQQSTQIAQLRQEIASLKAQRDEEKENNTQIQAQVALRATEHRQALAALQQQMASSEASKKTAQDRIADLSQKLTALQLERNTLSQQHTTQTQLVTTKQVDIAARETQIKGLQQELAALKVKMDEESTKYAAEVSKLQKRFAESQTKLDEAEKKWTESLQNLVVEQTKNAASTKLLAVTEEQIKLLTSAQQAEIQKTALTTQIQQLTQQLEAAHLGHTTLSQQHEALKTQHGEGQSKTSSLQQKLVALEQELAQGKEKLQEEQTKHTASKRASEGQNQNAQRQIQELRAQLAAVQEKSTELEQQAAERLSAQKSRVDALTDEVTTLKRNQEELGQQKARIEQEMAAKKALNNQLTNNVKLLQKSIIHQGEFFKKEEEEFLKMNEEKQTEFLQNQLNELVELDKRHLELIQQIESQEVALGLKQRQIDWHESQKSQEQQSAEATQQELWQIIEKQEQQLINLQRHIKELKQFKTQVELQDTPKSRKKSSSSPHLQAKTDGDTVDIAEITRPTSSMESSFHRTASFNRTTSHPISYVSPLRVVQTLEDAEVYNLETPKTTEELAQKVNQLQALQKENLEELNARTKTITELQQKLTETERQYALQVSKGSSLKTFVEGEARIEQLTTELQKAHTRVLACSTSPQIANEARALAWIETILSDSYAEQRRNEESKRRAEEEATGTPQPLLPPVIYVNTFLNSLPPQVKENLFQIARKSAGLDQLMGQKMITDEQDEERWQEVIELRKAKAKLEETVNAYKKKRTHNENEYISAIAELRQQLAVRSTEDKQLTKRIIQAEADVRKGILANQILQKCSERIKTLEKEVGFLSKEPAQQELGRLESDVQLLRTRNFALEAEVRKKQPTQEQLSRLTSENSQLHETLHRATSDKNFRHKLRKGEVKVPHPWH